MGNLSVEVGKGVGKDKFYMRNCLCFQMLARNQWRRECQSIPIDVQAVFHSSTWEPTVLATSHWLNPCARCAPSLCAIFRRPGRGQRPGHLSLRRRRSEDAERAIAANDFLRS
jgi:hypothetical protein